MKNQVPMNDAARIEASISSKESKISAAKVLSKWFEIDICIKLFGVTIFSWHFPPKEDSPICEDSASSVSQI